MGASGGELDLLQTRLMLVAPNSPDYSAATSQLAAEVEICPVELHMCSFGAAERAPPSVARSQLSPPALPPAGAFFEGRPIKKPTLMWVNMPAVAAAYQARVGGRGALLPWQAM